MRWWMVIPAVLLVAVAATVIGAIRDERRRNQILDQLRQRDTWMTQAELAETVGCRPKTVRRLLEGLWMEHLIVSSEPFTPWSKRPDIKFRIDKSRLDRRGVK